MILHHVPSAAQQTASVDSMPTLDKFLRSFFSKIRRKELPPHNMFRRNLWLRVATASAGGGSQPPPIPDSTAPIEALRLKEAATSVMVKYSPDVPHKAFLFRGNAYMALGQPYFAIPDYQQSETEMAGSAGMFLDLAKEHLARLPEKVYGAFPGIADNQTFLIDGNISDKCEAVGITQNPDDETPILGKGGIRNPEVIDSENVYAWKLFAKKDLQEPIPPNEKLILKHKTFAGVPLTKEVCSYCLGPLRTRTFLCKENDSCEYEYCSKECRDACNAKYHAKVCNIAPAKDMEINLENDLEAATDPASRTHYIAMLLTIRILAIALRSNTLPSQLKEMRILPGKCSFYPGRFEEDIMKYYIPFAVGTKTINIFCVEEFLGLYARVLSNMVVTEERALIAPAASVVQTVSLRDSRANARRENDGTVVSTREILAGEEIFVEG